MEKQEILKKLSDIRLQALKTAEELEQLTKELAEKGIINEDVIQTVEEEYGPFDSLVDRLMDVGATAGIDFNETPFIE